MRYFSRDALFVDRARGRKVLHLGCVGFADLDTDSRVRLAAKSLHYKLSQVADVTGIDYSRDAIEYFREHGVFSNVVYGNAEELENIDLVGTFDVIVVGDIIEHLSNPGRMLEGLRRFCADDSLLVISTPHSFGLPSYVRHVLGRFREGAEHVMTFNAQNLRTLLARHGFEVISIDTCHQAQAERSSFFKIGRAFFTVFPRLGGTLLLQARPVRCPPSS